MQENEENTVEWEPPPPPASAEEPKEEAQMSEVATLGNIFFEPENTFRDLKRKPRFIIAGVIIALLVAGYAFGIASKIGEAGMRNFIAEQIDKSPQGANLDKDQKAKAIDLQLTIGKYTRFALPVFIFASFFIGGLLYWLGAKAFGGTGSYMQNLSVWVYSGFAPGLVGLLASFLVMFFKSADDIDLVASQKGLIQQYTNLAFLVGKDHNILATLISTLDIFAIWGWILAAIGLRVTNKMSNGSAWALVLLITVIGLIFRLIGSMLSGNPS